MPDFGIKTALSEFGKAVEGKKFKHPDTQNMVLYTSLPMNEQHRIYEQWKQYQSLLGSPSKEGTKVDDVGSLKQGDRLIIRGPQATIEVMVTGSAEGHALAKKIDSKTGKPTDGKTFSISQEAVEAFDVRRKEEPKKEEPKKTPFKKNPFKNRETWPKMQLDDVFEGDVISYRVKGNDRMGRVVRVSKESDKFWIQEVDPKTGKVRDKTERSFDQSKIEERDTRLVDEDLWGGHGTDEGEYGSTPSGWSGGWKPKPKKELSPEEKKKLEEEHKAKEAARKKAVEKMGKTGKPVTNTKEVKLGDVISYHHDGEVYHGRVIDARGHEFFTIDIDPETGKLKEHGFEEWRGYGLKQNDVHKVNEEHVPEDPAEDNEQALYEGLPKLEEDPKKYFREDKASKLVDMSKIKPAKVRLKGVLNGNELLAMAAKDKYGKRKPVSLIDNGDDTYTVRDGNSTFKNAELSGWGQIPAVIKTKEQWEAHDKKEEERKQQQFSFPAQGHGQAPKITKEPAPKTKPESFKGEVLESVKGLSKGDLFGYEHDGQWFVGRVDRVGKDGDLFVDSLHPDNGRLTTLKYIRFDGDKLKDAKAMRLKDDHEFPKKKKKEGPRLPPKKDKGSTWESKWKELWKGKGKEKGNGKPFMFASRAASAEEMRAVLADIRQAYRPRWQDTPGYKTVVDVDSDKGIYPAQTESTSPDRGQDNMDSSWPVQLPQSREKERALPLPSNHSMQREKRIGPTTYNKPRHVPYRTLSEPGEEYGHPTKYDYNMPTRRNESLAGTDDSYEEDPIDDPLEPVANEGRQGPFPKVHQQNQGGTSRIRSRQWYLRHPAKRRKEQREYQMRDKRMPKEKLKDKYYRMYPHRYTRRGIGFTTPAERTKAWREENKADERRKGPRKAQERQAGLELLAEAFEMLGLELLGSNWPTNWNTQVKDTTPPEQLDQNYGKDRNRGTGTPRTDPGKQKGEDLSVPNLQEKHQPGLFTQHEPPAAGAVNTPTTNNPTDGSGKVLPMEWYSDAVNNTQAIPDGRQDRYERNNNFDVKQATAWFIHELTHPECGVGSNFGPGHERVAMTVGDVLKRCDRKIQQRAKGYTPNLARIDTKNWIWHWDVGDHTVRVQAFKRGNASNFPKLNLRVSCSCPFWRWWGPAHWATKSDYQKGTAPGTAAYPKVRDPAHWRPVCKHAYAVLEKSMKFFVRPEKSPLRKLGSRFSVDSPDAIEVVVEQRDITARVAQRSVERELVRRVARRYVEREESR